MCLYLQLRQDVIHSFLGRLLHLPGKSAFIEILVICYSINHFMSLTSFYTPRKHQKDIGRDSWHEMG